MEHDKADLSRHSDKQNLAAAEGRRHTDSKEPHSPLKLVAPPTRRLSTRR